MACITVTRDAQILLSLAIVYTCGLVVGIALPYILLPIHHAHGSAYALVGCVALAGFVLSGGIVHAYLDAYGYLAHGEVACRSKSETFIECQ